MATLHMIGNAHIDPVWLWQWQEGFHEVHATFRSALDRMNEYDDFLFISSAAQYYEWIEQSDPAMFAEIKQRVAEGRWEIVGGWWIQPDCNIPSGESFVRQGLYAQRYFKEKFGVTARVGYNVDSFGHAGTLPQILKKSGLDYYVFMRPSPVEKGLPSRLFWWEADDGTRVLTFRIMFEYLTWGKEVDQHVRRCAQELKAPIEDLMCFYGVGNHGGGPTKENIESIQRLNADPDYPTLLFSTPERYFSHMAAQDLSLPVVHDDLQHHASGCYAVHSGIKHWNRQAENRLLAAEKFSTIAAQVVNQPYPADFTQAWKGVLFNQFHDILAGTSLESAYDDARQLFGESMAIAGRNLNLATQALAWKINIPAEEGARPIVVFNPHAWASRVNIENEFGPVREGDVLLDDAGQEISFQTVQSEATAGGRHRLSWVGELPPVGYRTYRLLPRAKRTTFPNVEASDTVAENERLRLEIDPETGWIKSLRDKLRGVEVFDGAAAQPVVIADESDTWSHGVYTFDQEIGAFEATRVHLVEHGPVKAVIRVHSQWGHSTLIQDFSVYHDLNQIDVAVTVDWRDRLKMLKLRFPVHVQFHKATYEAPYGSIERFANGEENPGQGWIDVSGTSRDTGVLYGCSILNDAKYSFDVRNRDIGMTVLRSPAYAHHDPAILQADKTYSYIDQGIQHFCYTILPHDGSWEQAGTVRRAAELNQRPITLNVTSHEGPLPQAHSFASVEPAHLHLSVIKRWEDGDDLIVRIYETAKIATKGKICILDRTFEADFGAAEIKTFRVPKDKKQPVTETNMLEWSE
ncbi:MAG: alpha-mannosidase [Anaerolineaceae bacterium]|nr:alpha-mannosidase [Anaerolineaceae bacterium]